MERSMERPTDWPMDRHRGDRPGSDDRPGSVDGPRKMPSSRWSSEGGSPANDNHRFSRGGSGGGFSGGGARFHPYRGPQDYPSGGGPGFRDGGYGHQGPMGGPKQGFSVRGGGSPGTSLGVPRVSSSVAVAVAARV